MPDEHSDKPLADLCILVTRPREQARNLCRLIEAAGGRALAVPVLEIRPSDDPAPARALVDCLETFDLAIFISTNAVDYGHRLVMSRGGWPPGLRLAVVGKRSAEALVRYGMYADICPKQVFNSESLLAEEEMWQVAGKKIIIFRGEGGRELLASTLRERGATVSYAEVYRRTIPEDSPARLNPLLHDDDVDIIVVSSNEGIQNLYKITDVENRDKLLQIPLVVMSHRNALFARKLGFIQEPVIASQSSDEGLVAAIEAWYAINKNESSRRVIHE